MSKKLSDKDKKDWEKFIHNREKIPNKDLVLKKTKYPEISELKKIIIYLRKIQPDLIIAIGGGSVIDYAKISNVLTFTNNLKKKIINSSFGKIKKYTKLLAIPTTAGSGAEVTSNAVIYVNKIK